MSEVLARLMDERISSLYRQRRYERAGPPLAADTGIITERDLLRAVARQGGATLGLPVGEVASCPLATVPADAFVYRAIGRMSRLHVRHLGVIDEAGRVIGAVSARDLLRLRAGRGGLARRRDRCGDGRSCARRRLVEAAAGRGFGGGRGLSAREVAAVISREVGALTRQAAVIARARMRELGQANRRAAMRSRCWARPVAARACWRWIRTTAVVVDGAPAGPEDRWFEPLGATSPIS